MKCFKFLDGKEPKKPITEHAFSKAIATSVFSICICLICLCGMTWAWFSSTQTGTAEPIRSAEYSITVLVGETQLSDVENSFNATNGTTYNITLTAGGTATTGFCVVSYTTTDNGDTKTGKLYTEQLSPGEILHFSISLNNGGKLIFQPQWGTHANPTDIYENTHIDE